MSFLPVGHTHEDVDQMFSVFAKALRNTDVMTPGELNDICSRSFHYGKSGMAAKFRELKEVSLFVIIFCIAHSLYSRC